MTQNMPYAGMALLNTGMGLQSKWNIIRNKRNPVAKEYPQQNPETNHQKMFTSAEHTEKIYFYRFLVSRKR